MLPLADMAVVNYESLMDLIDNQGGTRDALADYKTWNGKVNAICFERFAEARKAALEPGKRWKNGTARALEGITVGIKNENEVKGWRVAAQLSKVMPKLYTGKLRAS